MRIVTIGDVHGRDNWLNAVYKLDDKGVPTECLIGKELDMVIFLGDYVDSFDKKDAEVLSNLNNIIQLKKDYPDNVILLLGNHDLAYICQNYLISGFRFSMMHDLFALFQVNKKLFQIAFQIKNTIWTHAGIHKGWWNLYVKPYITGKKEDRFSNKLINCKNQADYLNLMYAFNYEPLYMISYYRGGTSKVGGPVWADRREVYTKPLEGLYQVVGHTPVNEVKTYNFPKINVTLTFCDCLEHDKFYYLTI